MRSLSKTLFVLIFGVFISSGIMAQSAPISQDSLMTPEKRHEEETHKVLKLAMKYAETKNFKGFGSIMAYAGRDKNRTLVSKMNPDDPHEKLDIEMTCARLHQMLEKANLYNESNFRIVAGYVADLLIWDVEFIHDNSKKDKTYKFTFVKVKGEYLLARIDEK